MPAANVVKTYVAHAISLSDVSRFFGCLYSSANRDVLFQFLKYMTGGLDVGMATFCSLRRNAPHIKCDKFLQLDVPEEQT